MGRQEVLRRRLPWLLCAVAVSLLVLAAWLRWLVRDGDSTTDPEWLERLISALGFVGIPVVGALIASRQPANPCGWLWCAVGLVYGLSDVSEPLVAIAGWPAWLAWTWGVWGFVAVLALLVHLFLLFPDGHLPTPRWRWLSTTTLCIAVALSLAVTFIPDPESPGVASPWALQGEAASTVENLGKASLLGMFVLVLGAMSSLVARFRRAGPVERRQLTLFLYVTVLNGVVILVDSLGPGLPGLSSAVVSSIGFALLPVAVGIAMLRYRLYEIDRIVSRTVSYGLLTGGLVVLYLGLVTLLRPLLEPLTGSSALAVAGSTLAVAAVFNPARRRLQESVDRRFDRARYDAARAVDAFAARLRNQVDLDEVTSGLRDTVDTTVAPTRIAIWLRASSGTGGA